MWSKLFTLSPTSSYSPFQPDEGSCNPHLTDEQTEAPRGDTAYPGGAESGLPAQARALHPPQSRAAAAKERTYLQPVPEAEHLVLQLLEPGLGGVCAPQ